MKITDFAVLFDMDGLLFDTEATLKRVWQSEAAKLGFVITDEMFARCVGVPNAVCEANLVQWLKDFPIHEFQRNWRRTREAQRDSEAIPPRPGAAEMLLRLYELQVPMALATSSSQRAVERNRQAFPDMFRFSAEITIEQVQRPKPDPDIYHRASARLGLSASQCVIFEDSNTGMRAAVASGARAIMIPDLVQPDEDVAKGAFRIYASLHDALERMPEWFGRGEKQ